MWAVWAVIALLGLVDAALKPPKEWKLCPRSDPAMGDCLKDAITAAIRGLADGHRKFGVLPLEPLHLDKLEVDQADGPVALNVKFDHVDIAGASYALIDSVKADWDKVSIELEAHLEEPGHSLIVNGHYSVSGKVLTLPIQGSGACHLKFDNFKAKFLFDGKKSEKDGETYVDFSEVQIDFDTSKLHIQLENLFNGDKALSDQMNLFLNENWSQILEELKPAVSKAMGAATTQIVNTIFHKVPLNQISPP